jgi:HSP90 family molecular chaperone
MRELHGAKGDSDLLKEFAELLYDQALLTEGSKVISPETFCNRLTGLMLKAVSA